MTCSEMGASVLGRMLCTQTWTPLVATASLDTAAVAEAVFPGWPGCAALAVALAPPAPGEQATAAALDRIDAAAAAATPFVTRATPRGGSAFVPTTDKIDLRLDDDWADAMRAHCPALGAIDALVGDARAALGEEMGGELGCMWHLVITWPGSAAQYPHCDHSTAGETYATLIIDLSAHEGQGRTAFLVRRGANPADVAQCDLLVLCNEDLDEEDDARHITFDDCNAVLFGGDAAHYGQANGSDQPRVALSLTLTDAAVDVNDESDSEGSEYDP